MSFKRQLSFFQNESIHLAFASLCLFTYFCGIDFFLNSFYVLLLFYVSGLVNYYISSLGFPLVAQW